MKAKRFLSLLLSLALTASLAAPALAEEADAGLLEWNEFVAQYMENSAAAENFDANAYFEEQYGSWWPKDEYMRDMDLDSEEAFQGYMWQMYLDDDYSSYPDLTTEMGKAYNAYVLEYYEATHPGELESVSIDDLLAWVGYTETLTPVEQFMKSWMLDSEDEARATLLLLYAQNRLRVEKTHADFLVYQESYPEEWAGFDADAYLAEVHAGYDGKDAYMKAWDLRSEQEFVEDMFVAYVVNVVEGDWDWDYYDWFNSWYHDDQDYERLITLYANGQFIDTEVTAVDGATYADPAVLGEIMGTQFPGTDPISIRSAAQTAGWDVVWNQRYKEVALLDRERLLTGVIVPEYGWVEEDLSGLDRLAERTRATSRFEPGQSYQTTGTVDLTYTALNSLDGDQTYTAQIKVDTLTRDQICQASFSMDLADLLRLAPDRLLEEVKAELPKSARDLKALLTGVKVDLIWNGETGMLYVNAPIAALLDPAPGVDGDTWYAFDLSEYQKESANVSQALYQSLLEESADSWGGVDNAYSDFATRKGLLHILFGPHAVTEKNGTLTWKLDEEMIDSALHAFMGSIGEPIDQSGDYSFFKECRLELTIDPKGNTSLDMVFRPDSEGMTAAYGYYSFYTLLGVLLNPTDFRFSAQGQSSAKGGSANLELHWKNRFKLALDMDTARKEVKKTPQTTPPKGALIVELD